MIYRLLTYQIGQLGGVSGCGWAVCSGSTITLGEAMKSVMAKLGSGQTVIPVNWIELSKADHDSMLDIQKSADARSLPSEVPR